MKRGIMFAAFVVALALIAGHVLIGCAINGNNQVQTVFTQPCDIYESVGATPENSLIAAKIKNPCAAQSILATAAKAPLIWHQERYAELFEEWASKIQGVIDAGVTYSDLQDVVLVQIAKLNNEAGMALLMVSDGIFVFDDQASLIGEIDRKLLSMSIQDLRSQVKKMALIAG